MARMNTARAERHNDRLKQTSTRRAHADGRHDHRSEPGCDYCQPKPRAWLIDGGHGWLRVTAADVERSGFKPSEYSYTDGIHVYLEEDCDAFGFLCLELGTSRATLEGQGEASRIAMTYPHDYVDGDRQDVRGLPRVQA